MRSAQDPNEAPPRLDQEPIQEEEEEEKQHQEIEASKQALPESIDVQLDITVAKSQTVNDSTIEQELPPFQTHTNMQQVSNYTTIEIEAEIERLNQ